MVFGWVRRPDGMLLRANFDDGYLYTQDDEFRYGPGTRTMSQVDPTGWTIAEGSVEG